MRDLIIPLSVPKNKKAEYKKNISLLTNNSGNLFLIAGDQKIEHLNDDFFGKKIHSDDNSPEHLFKIASKTKGAALATHLGLISKYAMDYKNIPYIVKINGKTNIGPNEEKDSSKPMWKIKDVLEFKKQSGLKIVGIGYTLYLGGKYEAKMLAKAAKSIFEAHREGLAAILWVYPRGKGIKEEDIHTIAGGAGVAACLDADFAKVKYPYNTKDKKETAKKFQEVIKAAGRTKIICVGGEKTSTKDLLNYLKLQIETGTNGIAIGRNLHQRSLEEALKVSKEISAILTKNKNKGLSKILGLF